MAPGALRRLPWAVLFSPYRAKRLDAVKPDCRGRTPPKRNG
jgi:hypothetical protein